MILITRMTSKNIPTYVLNTRLLYNIYTPIILSHIDYRQSVMEMLHIIPLIPIFRSFYIWQFFLYNISIFHGAQRCYTFFTGKKIKRAQPCVAPRRKYVQCVRAGQGEDRFLRRATSRRRRWEWKIKTLRAGEIEKQFIRRPPGDFYSAAFVTDASPGCRSNRGGVASAAIVQCGLRGRGDRINPGVPYTRPPDCWTRSLIYDLRDNR